jgi:hypothetical protein
MRANANDPKARHLLPYLDGRRLRLCISADEEAGVAVVHKTGSDGNLCVVGGVIETELLHGIVEIIDLRTTPETETRPIPQRDLRRCPEVK